MKPAHQKVFTSHTYNYFFILAIAILIAIASEVKIIPYEGAPFRFGLGTIIFLLFILIRPLPLIKTGVITGIVVVLFRTFLDFFLQGNSFLNSAMIHVPASFFYISFAIFLKLININRFKSRPFLLAILVTSCESISNLIEQVTTSFILNQNIPFTLEEILLLVLVAFIRSFFVVGIYSSITVAEQKKQMQQLLNMLSNLYVETLYLNKSLHEIETITANSYELYEQLKETQPMLSMKALSIAQEIHEVKKDGQRIYAGLSKLTDVNQFDAHSISNILHYVKDANEKYSALLNKKINISVSCNKDFPTREYIPLLALINNLVANSVEAIENEGDISISIHTNEDFTTITVEDNGIGIPENFIPVIFDPGFTSKYNHKGEPSTGIGLSHAQTIVHRLEGTIQVESDATTTFTVTIPFNKLQI